MKGKPFEHEQQAQGLPPQGASPGPLAHRRARPQADRSWSERQAAAVFVLPAVLVVLALSVFPLLLSLYISLSRLRFVAGGFEVRFVGLANYRKLLFGSESTHLLGLPGRLTPLHWLLFALLCLMVLVWLARSLRGRALAPGRLIWRGLAALLLLGGGWLLLTALPPGRPGTLGVTLIYVLFGVMLQYLLGLGLALLTAQRLPGRRFFRVVFLLPMMITPVGVAYMFRMLADTSKGPFSPVWQALGLGHTSWVNDPWGARAAVLIGDIWQWTPFMFIVLLAALEGQPVEPLEAAVVDGASRWQMFRYITWPAVLPVSSTLLLIRTIEAFKIIDLPNVLTNGGPGTATESLTLHAYIAWRTLDLGGSAAIAYVLLFVVTLIAVSYVNLVRQRFAEGL